MEVKVKLQKFPSFLFRFQVEFQKMSGKLTIKPFKHQVLMDRKAAEAEWLLLKQSIDKVFECNISNLKFEILYRYIN